MSVNEATRNLRMAATPYDRAVQRFVCPLFGVLGRTMQPVGTGFLIELSSCTILVTAAHVLDAQLHCTLHLPGQTGLVPLIGDHFTTALHRPSKPPDEDPHDFGFVVLNSDAMIEK